MRISEELFCELMTEVKRANEYEDDLNSLFIKYRMDTYMGDPMPYVNTIKAISISLAVKEQDIEEIDDLISWWCWEVDWGEKASEYHIYLQDNTEIEIPDLSALYKYIITNYKENQNILYRLLTTPIWCLLSSKACKPI